MTDPYLIFVGFYDLWSAALTEDVEFYVRRALEAEGPAVELAVGNGRVAIPTAQAGKRVIGVDVSEAMLADGRRRAREAGVEDRIEFVHGDMREFVADPPVELVTIPFRSFLHLTTSEDQLRALGRARASLVTGGRLILNMFLPDPEHIVGQDGRRNHHGEFTDEKGRRVDLWAIPRYEIATQIVRLTVMAETLEGDRVVETAETELVVRMVHRYEMEHLLARAGFEVEALYGGFDERPLTEECREMIWVARKP